MERAGELEQPFGLRRSRGVGPAAAGALVATQPALRPTSHSTQGTDFGRSYVARYQPDLLESRYLTVYLTAVTVCEFARSPPNGRRPCPGLDARDAGVVVTGPVGFARSPVEGRLLLKDRLAADVPTGGWHARISGAGQEGGMSERGQLQHPWFARLYVMLSRAAEKGGAAEHRGRLLAGLTGRVIEVGAGNGLNFAHYPATVTDVLAVEPDDVLRAHAEVAARRAPVLVRVVPGQADALPAEDRSRDAAVASLVLCSVADPASALARLHRVLRPGGQLRFYEHVRSGRSWVGAVQDLIAAPWSHVAGGCRPNRDTLTSIRTAGFEVADVEEISFGMPHVLGRAVRVD